MRTMAAGALLVRLRRRGAVRGGGSVGRCALQCALLQASQIPRAAAL